MISMSLTEVAGAIGGEHRGADVIFLGVSTDTRTLKRGALFVALKGERFDGHDSLPEAVIKGAAGAIVERVHAASIPSVCVDNTRRALGRLAKRWRRRYSMPLIGITGSNGKTTTKEMTAAILRQRFQVLVTSGNLNND
ncbi:MAG: Mur ligase domain-containing protein, partial [Gammaproteobacteria bacterium]